MLYHIIYIIIIKIFVIKLFIICISVHFLFGVCFIRVALELTKSIFTLLLQPNLGKYL